MPWDTLPSSPTAIPAPAPFIPLTGLGADRWGRVGFLHYFRPPGLPLNFLPDGTPVIPPVVPDLTNNLTHGFEAFRNPPGTNGSVMAAMPFDLNTGTTVPTYPYTTSAGTIKGLRTRSTRDLSAPPLNSDTGAKKRTRGR